MRFAITLLLAFASASLAQTPEVEAALEAKLATLKFLGSLHDPESGGYRAEPAAKPGLRATNAAVKATKYLGGKLADREKAAKFVLGCYDDKTGAFAEPGGQPDVVTTCIGVMAAMELGIAKEKIAKAQGFIVENAKTFEEIRMGCAAVEAWGGVKGWPIKIQNWVQMIGDEQKALHAKYADTKSDLVWALGGIYAARMRLGDKPPVLKLGTKQWADGGYGREGKEASDMETTYRVMRTVFMFKDALNDPAKLREFVGKHRDEDGGYAIKPGGKSSAAGTYYAVIVTKWLDELEK